MFCQFFFYNYSNLLELSEIKGRNKLRNLCYLIVGSFAYLIRC
ncbi:hypothetical protein HMPREF1383_02425 [Enterococcus faecium V689]|nr:hypothetical protein EfmE1071_2581 [Enterococcus faecium E1071]EFR69813.1 hypothetical protein HMPREF9524_00027 [Enterococcus faecium TX0133a01]EFR70665.1 hypothetical protein HMPREF9526_02315 [Enterococcus faecium TX0133B]EFR73927.1 hypothetical protein HMPREF9523_02177 [Enterococcus faecium TX0133A]EFR77571.1 hypothetical protein HMPREF9527_01605 [Enterococcus faecium TX0133C]EFS05266.1 hypothetical protein HMPREF9525_02646 [Enterococcus faecium TX0133a04]EFS08798.1 hypothetical protein 